MRRQIIAIAVAITGFSGAGFGLASSASATTSGSYATQLVQLVNEARAQHGLSALKVASGTSEVAQAWASHLAATSSLSHNPNLVSQLESHGSRNWQYYGENVGAAPTAQDLFNDYMNSPEHRSNILDADYRYVGVGVTMSNGNGFNTLDFVDSYGSTTTTTHRAAATPTVHRTSTSHPAVARTTTRTVPVTHAATARTTKPHTAARVTTPTKAVTPVIRPAVLTTTMQPSVTDAAQVSPATSPAGQSSSKTLAALIAFALVMAGLVTRRVVLRH